MAARALSIDISKHVVVESALCSTTTLTKHHQVDTLISLIILYHIKYVAHIYHHSQTSWCALTYLVWLAAQLTLFDIVSINQTKERRWEQFTIWSSRCSSKMILMTISHSSSESWAASLVHYVKKSHWVVSVERAQAAALHSFNDIVSITQTKETDHGAY